MEQTNKHTARMALVLAFMVVLLVVVSIDRFTTEDTSEQQAAVLRVYAQ